MKEVNIMHVDMDAFFASVEILDNPELEGKPVIVGGANSSNRGVVSTASYEARKYGVHSAMPIVKAKKLCPHAIYLPGRMKRYEELSKKIHKIFQQYTPLVEKISIDEAFLDLSGCHKLFGSSEKIGKKIKHRIKDEIGLIASVGISKNKFLSKLASTVDKPDGFKIIYHNEVDEFLEKLSISKLWGVGQKTEKILKEQGINTVAMLKTMPKTELEEQFGKLGIKLYNLARGIDKRKVLPAEDSKSISQEETFSKNLSNKLDIFSVLMGMCEKVSERLHKENLKGKTIFIKIIYPDFSTYSRRKTLNQYTNNTEKIYKTAKELLMKNNLLSKPIRLLGVGAANLSQKNKKQLSLFEKDKKSELLDKTITDIKNKFGNKSLRRGIDLVYNKERNRDN